MSLTLDPYQHTIRSSTSCCGVGLHSGRTVNLSMKPAPVDSGIRFLRTDMPGRKYLVAHMDKVVDTRLATTIGNESFHVSTTEHLLAALKAYGVDNVDIELDSAEVPIMDGSASPFYQLLKKCGKKRQNGFRKVLRITRPISYSDGQSKLTVKPYEGFKITGEICFDDTIIKKQKFSLDLSSDTFEGELSRARTFGYVEQVEELWANGLALGGSLANVIAIHWNRKSVLNEDGLRYQDEFIRHKVLDLVGDLALLGCPVFGHVEAYKAGHAQHLGLMKQIANSPDSWEIIALEGNGKHTVIDLFSASSKMAMNLLPFLNGKLLQPSVAI